MLIRLVGFFFPHISFGNCVFKFLIERQSDNAACACTFACVWTCVVIRTPGLGIGVLEEVPHQSGF